MPAIDVLAQRTAVLLVYDHIVEYTTILCHRYHVRSPDSDDLVQEVLTAIVASADTYQPEKGPFDKWARGVARNIIYGYLRRTTQFLALFSEYHPNVEEYATAGSTPESSLQQMQTHRQISIAVDSLSERQFQVLTLRADGKSHREIAEELSITVALSEKCSQRARDHLAQCVTEENRCVLPAVETSCNDSAPAVDGAWQWIRPGQWAHYSGQISAAIIAFLLFIPSNRVEEPRASLTSSIQTAVQLAMYRFDKQSFVSDKPTVCPDPLGDKPQPASLPSAPVTNASKRYVDKPTPLPLFAPLPSRKYAPSSTDHRPRGR